MGNDNSSKIIGRKIEKEKLKRIYNSQDSEFIAIYGRRRVGKSFLIKSYFTSRDCIYFEVVGIENEGMDKQLMAFNDALVDAFYRPGTRLEKPKNWYDAFKILTTLITSDKTKKKIVLFFDELPWLATRKSGLIQALGYYWNKRWSQHSNIKLIVCGSAAAWIMEKIIHNKGGLHNRITNTIKLEPFSLKETKEFLLSRKIKLDNVQILALYMVMGGIPFYLKRIDKGLSAIQIIDGLCFTTSGFLFDEFRKLYKSLYGESEVYIDIIRLLASYRQGLSRKDVLEKSNMASGGTFDRKIEELELAGFIEAFVPLGHKKRGVFYRLVDEYSLFYLSWIEPVISTIKRRKQHTGYWEKICHSSSWKSWAGYAFEAVCYKHIHNIAKALKISDDAEIGSWKYVPYKNKGDDNGAQIDLVFDRRDDIVSLCEIKYTATPFVVDKKYAKNIMNKMQVYKAQTRTKKQIFVSIISANGIKDTMYSDDLITSVATIEDLFEE